MRAGPEPQSKRNSGYPPASVMARKSRLPVSSLYSSVPSAKLGWKVISNSMKERYCLED